MGEALFDLVQRSLPDRRRKNAGILSSVAEPFLQVDTALRGAADTLTFSEADEIASGLNATLRPWDGTWQERYDAAIAKEEARNRYDAEYRSTARTIGEMGGLGVMLARGPKLSPVFAVPRLPGAAAITGREAASLIGAGGAVGVGSQAVGDAATRRLSSPGDYIGAGIGGVAGVLAMPGGANRAAAVDGAVTSMAQDLLNGRPISPRDAGEAAMAARTLGTIANNAAMKQAEALSIKAKGKLGEALGAIRAVADWRPRVAMGNTLVPIPGTRKKWKPDARRGSLLYEDKFGKKATLRPNQKIAREKLGDDFQLNHFLPSDIGVAASAFGAALGIQAQRLFAPQPTR